MALRALVLLAVCAGATAAAAPAVTFNEGQPKLDDEALVVPLRP